MATELDNRLQQYDEVFRAFNDVVALEVVRELGIFENLLRGAATVEDLADKAGVSSVRLGPFIDLVVHLGFLRRVEGGCALIPGDEPLFDPSGVYAGTMGLGGLARFASRRGAAVEVLRADQPLVSPASGGSVSWEERKKFFEHAHLRTAAVAEEVATLLGTADLSRFADLGCGPGTYSFALLKRCEHSEGVLVDRAPAAEFIELKARELDVESRTRFVGADFLQDDFGAGFDVVLVSENIHNYGEPQNRALLKRTWEVLNSGGQIAIKDVAVAPDRSGPKNALRFAVDMSIFSENGGLYSVSEVLGWLSDTGFESAERHSLGESPHSYLVVASKP